MPNFKRLTVIVPDELHLKVKSILALDGQSISDFIRWQLTELTLRKVHIKKEKKKAA